MSGMGFGGMEYTIASERMRSEAYECGVSEGFEDGVREGRREMLWLMAIGVEVERWRSQCSEDSFADCWYRWIRNTALRALRDLGDEQAREMLR